jgi:UBX domain-containing protein 7
MDGTAEGRTYTERYQVLDYPHIGIIDPRTGRLLWRKEGWTQENPVTAETFAEIATDFCSRNSYDRPPQAPRPPGAAAAAASRPAKRPMEEMSEAEQLRAAMQASMVGASNDGKHGDDDDGEADIHYDDDEVEVLDSKAPAVEEKEPTLNTELQSFVVPDEPKDGYRIQLRLPGGKRAVRVFSPTDSVRTIYAYFAVRVQRRFRYSARTSKSYFLFPPVLQAIQR